MSFASAAGDFDLGIGPVSAKELSGEWILFAEMRPQNAEYFPDGKYTDSQLGTGHFRTIVTYSPSETGWFDLTERIESAKTGKTNSVNGPYSGVPFGNSSFISNIPAAPGHCSATVECREVSQNDGRYKHLPLICRVTSTGGGFYAGDTCLVPDGQVAAYFFYFKNVHSCGNIESVKDPSFFNLDATVTTVQKYASGCAVSIAPSNNIVNGNNLGLVMLKRDDNTLTDIFVQDAFSVDDIANRLCVANSIKRNADDPRKIDCLTK